MTKVERNNMMNCAIHRVVTRVEEIAKNKSPFFNSRNRKKITEKQPQASFLTILFSYYIFCEPEPDSKILCKCVF